MLWPGPPSSIFYLDPAAGLTDANLWKDSGPHGLHVTPNANYVAPNYGLGDGPSGARRITFNGANQCGTMGAVIAARFFTVAPTTQLTIAVVARHNAPAVADRVFTCGNAGSTRGFSVSLTTAERMQVAGYDAAGVLCAYSSEPDDAPYTSRTRITILAVEQAGSLARRWVDAVGRTPNFAGNVNPIAYDAAQIPVVGAHVGGGALFFDGDIYFLGVWPLVFTDSEAKAFSAFWLDRT